MGCELHKKNFVTSSTFSIFSLMFLIALIRQNVFNSYDLNLDLGIFLHTITSLV